LLHLLLEFWQAIDDHHREDVIDGHGASGGRIEDSIKGEARIRESIRVRGEGAGHRDLEEIFECMLSNCKTGHSGVGSSDNRCHRQLGHRSCWTATTSLLLRRKKR